MKWSLITAMAELRSILNFLRRWTASDSGEVFIIVLLVGWTGVLDNSCSNVLMLKAGG
jgi:hypothetical protein